LHRGAKNELFARQAAEHRCNAVDADADVFSRTARAADRSLFTVLPARVADNAAEPAAPGLSSRFHSTRITISVTSTNSGTQ
jgi:hypothetical protein